MRGVLDIYNKKLMIVAFYFQLIFLIREHYDLHQAKTISRKMDIRDFSVFKKIALKNKKYNSCEDSY